PSNTTIASSDGGTITGDGGNTLIFNFDSIEKNQSGKANFTITINKPLDNGTSIILDDVTFNYMVEGRQYSQKITSDLNHIIKSSPDFSNFDLKAVDENGAYLQMGDIIEYTLMVKNSGYMNATGVEIKSILSKNLSVIEESIDNSGIYKNNTVVWNINNFEINKLRTFKFRATVNYDLNNGDLIENKSTLICDQGIEVQKSTSDSVTLLPKFSDSEVFLSDANGGYLWAGETINIKIIIRNSGEKEAASYRLICHIPAGATYISGSGTPEGISWSDEIRGLIWDLSNLNVGSEKEINLQLRVNDDLFYTGGNIATDFKIESNDYETEIEQASLNVKKHIYMTIVVMGDSLIARSDWVQRFDQLLESTYPYADYNTIAAGVSGEKAYEGYARFDSTVAIYRPQIIIITYGTNDTGAGLTNFSVHLEGLIMKSRNLGATVFLNLIGPVFYSGKESYPQYNNEILKIAAKYSLPVIDVLSPLSQNPDRYLYDGVHYTTDGSAVVAQTVFNYVIQYLDDFGQRR
ncbi:MAG: GDSL-type esterase/lipase family protein, partial [Candidatus Hydromicrobium sp.]